MVFSKNIGRGMDVDSSMGDDPQSNNLQEQGPHVGPNVENVFQARVALPLKRKKVDEDPAKQMLPIPPPFTPPPGAPFFFPKESEFSVGVTPRSFTAKRF